MTDAGGHDPKGLAGLHRRPDPGQRTDPSPRTDDGGGSDPGVHGDATSTDRASHQFLDLAPAAVHLSTDDIVRGLKHYRRIAKQDLLRAEVADDPESTKVHAQARRDVYARLSDVASTGTPEEVALAALTEYARLPFSHGMDGPDVAAIKGRENALENVFLMLGLEAKVRREARKRRPPLRAKAED